MRHAMSMIELVFAIVIMGIAVMSLPLILTQVQNNNAFAMQQEAILAAKAKIGEILTYEWDDMSYDANASRSFVLDVANGSADLNRTNGQLRKGHVNAENRRKMYNTTTLATNIATHGNNDIDMFNGQDTNITASLAATEGTNTLDYVFTLKLSPTITYASDTATYSNTPLNNFTFNPANTNTITNIKTISVKVSGGDQNITLNTFSCNIGESSLIPPRPYQ